MDWLIELFFYRVVGGAIQAVFYWPGWLLLKMLTIGKYPPRQTVKHNRFAVAMFAVLAMAFLLAAALASRQPAI